MRRVTAKVRALLQERQDRSKGSSTPPGGTCSWWWGTSCLTEHTPLPSCSLLSPRGMGPSRLTVPCSCPAGPFPQSVISACCLTGNIPAALRVPPSPPSRPPARRRRLGLGPAPADGGPAQRPGARASALDGRRHLRLLLVVSLAGSRCRIECSAMSACRAVSWPQTQRTVVKCHPSSLSASEEGFR